MTALRAQIGIADRGALLVAGEAVREPRIGLEFGRAAIELSGMTEHHSGTAVHGSDHPADMYVQVAVLAQFANLVPVFPEADNGEPAALVGGIGRTNIQEAGSIGKFHHFIYMRRNANVFVEQAGGFVGGQAGPGARGKQ